MITWLIAVRNNAVYNSDCDSPEVKRRNRGPGNHLSNDDNYIRYHDNDTRHHDNDVRHHDNDVRSWCGSISDISQCSSRPISLCVKYNDSEVSCE